MKRSIEILGFVALLFCVLTAVSVVTVLVEAKTQAQDPVTTEVPITIVVDDAANPPEFTAELVEANDLKLVAARQKLNTMSRGEQRKLGITFWNIRRVTKELQREGVLTRGDRKGNAALVMTRIVGENTQAYEECRASYGDDEDGDKDWSAFFEALLAFLEKIIPLFMMFGGLS